MTLVYRYAGPDGEAIPALPAGWGAAIGSEYCAHLLPGPEAMRRALAASRDRGSPLILLTPYLRDAELKRALPLFRTIPDGADVTVAVNDWGALLALRLLFPRLDLSIGRLLSGQKRCPRIGVSGRLTPEGRRWHGLGLFSSRRAVAHLRDAFSVTGYHVDRLDWGPDPAAGADGAAAGGAPAGGQRAR